MVEDATQMVCKWCQDAFSADKFRRGVERGQVLMICPNCGHQWYLDGMVVSEIQISDEAYKAISGNR
jgi:RNase P subunit RPR2